MFINLRSALLLRGMRQYQLARRLGVSEQFLSMVIAGRRKLSPKLRKCAAKILQVDQDWLFQEISVSPERLPTYEMQSGVASSGLERANL